MNEIVDYTREFVREKYLTASKIIVAGGRDFEDYEYMCQQLDELIFDSNDIEYPTKIISGMAKGADELAIRYADERGLTKILFPANWKKYPRRAGFLRNEDMLSIATHLVAFWDGESHGTKHMIEIAQEKGIPVWVYNYRNPKKEKVITPEREQYLMELNAAWHREQEKLREAKNNGTVEKDEPKDSCIFIILKFRIERMIDYWREFSHLANENYIIAQMRLATRLIDIILGDGNERGYDAPLPYINQRNKYRIPEVRFHENRKGELQEIRFCKAYRLLFKLLEENIMHWWD